MSHALGSSATETPRTSLPGRVILNLVRLQALDQECLGHTGSFELAQVHALVLRMEA